MSDIQSLLILGCGYVGEKLAAACLADGMSVVGTTRSSERAAQLAGLGIESIAVASPADIPVSILKGVDAVVDSIPLSRSEQGMYAIQQDWLREMADKVSHVRWAAYLSTTGVYGDAGGAWVDEECACQPGSSRGIERLVAEDCWLNSGLPAEIFRLAGIYGPGRNMLQRLKAGGYQTVAWRPPHYSSRIHVDDIVAALMAAMRHPKAGRIVNLADDEPLPHADYVCELARLTGSPEPVILTEQEGAKVLPAAALEFFRDNKRISNRVLHRELLADLKYPSFRTAIHTLTE